MIKISSIVKSFLLRRQRTVHYFLDTLIHAIDGYKELSLDEFPPIVTKVVYADVNGIIPFPAGCIWVISLGGAYSQFIKPMVTDTTINTLNNYTTGGVLEPYTNNQNNNWDSYYYNSKYYDDGYKVDNVQRQVKVNEGLDITNGFIMEFASDGSAINGSTKIHPYAEKAVNAYIEWQVDYGGKARTQGAIKFGMERDKIRARVNPLTPNDIKRIIDRNAGVR